MVVQVEELGSVTPHDDDAELDDDVELDDEELRMPPTPAQLCDAAARRGDIIGVFNEIRSAAPQLIKHGDEFAKLEGTILRRMRDAPDDTIDLLLKHGCSVSGYLLMRLRFLLLFQIETANFLDPKCATPIYDRVMDVQEHIQRVERHLLDVKQSRAATKRLSELARSKKIENDRQEPTEAKTSPNHSPAKSNGHGVNGHDKSNGKSHGVVNKRF